MRLGKNLWLDETGSLIRCNGSVGAKVPPPGHGVSGLADGSSPKRAASGALYGWYCSSIERTVSFRT
jgi:hypothetical protein